MTVYGPDISSYQAGLDLSRLADASFVIAKACEGTYYTDGSYQGWRRQAASLKKPFVWYHCLSSENVSAQVAHTKACVGDLSLPGMLDVEPSGTSKPTLQQVLDYADASKAAGLRLRLVYLPHWYWQELGSPSLSGLTRRGLGLISSSYPGGSGSAPALYPGDKAAGWNAYGGVAPALYQYTNQASDGGRALDYNAFRGTVEQLLTQLGDSTMTGSYTMGPGWQTDYPDVAPALQKHIPAGTVVDDGDAAAYAMVRSFVAAERAGAIVGKLDQLLARTAPAPAPVDVHALAAELGPLLHPTTDVDALAALLAPHLGAQDPAALASAIAAHFKVV